MYTWHVDGTSIDGHEETLTRDIKDDLSEK